MDTTPSLQSQSINSKLRLFEIYSRTRYLSIKYDSYFQVYEQVLGQYVGKEITFVEVGIYNGGSLFMWREYFGPRARIIGIDLNPAARQWESHGFEIFIGSQSDPDFWRDFYAKVGPVDVLLDDGGHTNRQQIITVHESLPHIKDGGVILVEDVHASYMPAFGNPSRYSFINFAKHLVDSVNSRASGVGKVRNDYGQRVYAVSFYESIVVLLVDSTRCFPGKFTSNGGISADSEDFRLKGSVAAATVQGFRTRLRRHVGALRRLPFVESMGKAVFAILDRLAFASEDRKSKRFFD
jgi:Methyltransferase domain